MAVSRLSRPRFPTIAATGGDQVYDLPIPSTGLVFRVHRFLDSGDFTVTAGAAAVECLLQAGGGGGGGTSHRGGGSGGAGGLLILPGVPVDADDDIGFGPGVFPVVVGNGGAGGSGNNNGANGSNSTAFDKTAVGGGFGARNAAAARTAGNGGSGGGGWPSGIGTVGQGRPGSSRDLSFGTTGGGLDITLDFDGTSRLYAARGLPGGRNTAMTPPARAMFGRGGGGGNGDGTTAGGGAGGPGVVVIRYPVSTL